MPVNFADIVLPLAIKGRFTYRIPQSMQGTIIPGLRVMVQFGNKKLYSGIVSRVHNEPPVVQSIREILQVLDHSPLVNSIQMKLWSWIADYYMCTIGEVMKAALPSAFFLEGEKHEPVREKYRPKMVSYIVPASGYCDAELNVMLDKLAKAPKQFETLAAYLSLSGYTEGREVPPVKKAAVLAEAGSSPSALDALVRKGILTIVTLEEGRLEECFEKPEPLNILSKAQNDAFDKICENHRDKETVLLHGVTSGGKTEIYIHLIEQQLKLGRQVLYLLPEISLTTQIILRLRKHFGSATGIFHSRLNEAEKVEIWKKAAGFSENTEPYKLILGVRSALFLPFSNLGLIIVDEEQDGSYKQQDPAPRYNARDSAIVLGHLHKAKVLLGSASPSIESYSNALSGRYALVELKERYGLVKLPEIVVANTREAYRKKLMVSHFTPQLLEAIDQALGNREQAILFQNRRGFSPYIECPECGWIPTCINCAVNLTYHKETANLLCHYCGYSSALPSKCGNCQSSGLVTRGFGTEKIEDEIKIVFPAARVARVDHDSTRSKNSLNRLIGNFQEGQTDILIGTQMISKGLDFDNVTVVGILNADNLLNFPDFRAHERSFHMMEQVSGRAGRRSKQGKVIIQTADPLNKIIRYVLHHDYVGMFRNQMEERKTFNYPPFCRMIKIHVKHRERASLNHFAGIIADDLKAAFGSRVLGPEYPLISRVQNWYIKSIIIKAERERSLPETKHAIHRIITSIEKLTGASSLRIAVDVDPY